MPLRIDLNRKSTFKQARKFSHIKNTPARRCFSSYFFFLFCLLYLFIFLHCTILLHLHIKHMFDGPEDADKSGMFGLELFKLGWGKLSVILSGP